MVDGAGGGSSGPTLVVLAAGLGTRFGGAKQLAVVRADGATIMDVLLERAAGAGYAGAVIVVSPGVEPSARAHIAAMPAVGMPVQFAVQQVPPGRDRPLGTADAVLATRHLVARSFVVVNADDLYPADAFALLARHLRDAPADEHALVAFRVRRTRVGDLPVMRARLEVGPAAALIAIREGRVEPGPRGLQVETASGVEDLPDDEPVSMNMWGFRTSIFAVLAAAVAGFRASGDDGEVYLPDVVAASVVPATTVRVLVSEGTCIGVTHAADLAAVRDALA